jgi:hypothetical protein
MVLKVCHLLQVIKLGNYGRQPPQIQQIDLSPYFNSPSPFLQRPFNNNTNDPVNHSSSSAPKQPPGAVGPFRDDGDEELADGVSRSRLADRS